MDRWLIPTIAAVVALAIGFGIGAAVYGDDDPNDVASEANTATPDDSATPDAEAADQETCLAALDAAEQEVQAEERTSALLDEYESVLKRASKALADFDTRQLEQLLTRVEALNRRSERLIDESRKADISSAIETCRSVLGVNDT